MSPEIGKRSAEPPVRRNERPLASLHRVLLVLLAAAASWVPGDPPWVASMLTRIGQTGWAAAGLLIASLTVSPIARVLGRGGAGPARLRRHLGLGSCALVAVHIGWVLRAEWFDTAWALLTEPNLRSGATAAAVLAILGLTSSPRLVRALRLGFWKPLHRSVYAAALLVAHHIALSGHARPEHVIAFTAVVLGLLAARAL